MAWGVGWTLVAQSPVDRLGPLLGIPYRVDGVEDARGRFVTFAAPEVPRATAGLNCSGLVVGAARRLLGYTGDPAPAARDRLGDSGAGAPRGADWDFGWDLVLNLSEGLDRQWLTPEGPRPLAEDAGRVRGFGVHEAPAWEALRPRLRSERVYLVVFNRGQGARMRHHHVGVVLKAGARVWFYQTLPGGRAHRLDLASPPGMARLRAMFGPGERVRILEITPPHP